MNRSLIIKLSFYFFLLWFITHVIVLIFDGLSDKGEKADLAVILGTKVNEDGTLSERLIKRVDCGLQLYQNGRVKKIMVSGGFGKEGFWEGDKMRDYLVTKGIPPYDIIVDNKGNNTRETVKHVLQLSDSLNFKSILVVSQYFHLTRCKMLFKKNGIKNVSSVSPQYFEMRDIISVPREFFAFYTQL